MSYVLVPHTATRPGTYEAVTAVLPLEPAIDGRDLGRAVEHDVEMAVARNHAARLQPSRQRRTQELLELRLVDELQFGPGVWFEDQFRLLVGGDVTPAPEAIP